MEFSGIASANAHKRQKSSSPYCLSTPTTITDDSHVFACESVQVANPAWTPVGTNNRFRIDLVNNPARRADFAKLS